jgi:hypothetical protein
MFDLYDRNEEVDNLALHYAHAVRSTIAGHKMVSDVLRSRPSTKGPVPSVSIATFATKSADSPQEIDLAGVETRLDKVKSLLQQVQSADTSVASVVESAKPGSVEAEGNERMINEPLIEENKFDSKHYWENRYRSGGNSGAGSAGRLGTYKADFLNGFVRANNVQSVVEFGSGDGAQLGLFDFPMYLGIDVSEKAIADSHKLHDGNPKLEFLLDTDLTKAYECELSLSLDVIYHLVEDDVLEKYLRNLFFFATRFVIIYSSDFERPWNAQHVRHRHFTKMVSTRFPEWRRIATVANPYLFDAERPGETSFCDFVIYGQRNEPCTVFVTPPADG